MALKIGVVRWDATMAVGARSHGCMENVFSPPQYHYRAPFWADEVSAFKVELNPTQEDMDAEIDFARDNGIDFWMFLEYNPALIYPNATSNSMALYEASSKKADVKYTIMRQTNHMGTTGDYADEVAEMVAHVTRSNYQKVLGNRPLVFIFNPSDGLALYWGNSYANLKAAVDAFRAAAQLAGLGNPYIVTISTVTAAQSVADKAGIGADAATMYAVLSTIAPKQAYSVLANSIEFGTWPTLKAGGGMFPMCSQGHDRRPRIERPVFWETGYQKPFFGMDLYTVPPTPSQFQAHVEAGIAYIAANPTECAAEVLVIASWSEFDEGGGICPTLGDPTGNLLGAVLAART